jgi:hypothetical protein
MLSGVRNLDSVDDELRLIAAVRGSLRGRDVKLSGPSVNKLLDERHLVMPSHPGGTSNDG